MHDTVNISDKIPPDKYLSRYEQRAVFYLSIIEEKSLHFK